MRKHLIAAVSALALMGLAAPASADVYLNDNVTLNLQANVFAVQDAHVNVEGYGWISDIHTGNITTQAVGNSLSVDQSNDGDGTYDFDFSRNRSFVGSLQLNAGAIQNAHVNVQGHYGADVTVGNISATAAGNAVSISNVNK